MKTGKRIKVSVLRKSKKINGTATWRANMIDFLKQIDVANTHKRLVVYTFIFGHMNPRDSKLRMNNNQIYQNINKSGKFHISLHSVVDAIHKLEEISLAKNKKPIMVRQQIGRYGKKSYLQLNPVMIPRSNDTIQGLLIEYPIVSESKHQKLIDNKRQQRNKTQNKINELRDKLKKQNMNIKRLENKGVRSNERVFKNSKR